MEILSLGVAARPWVPSAVTTVWPHLAMKGDAHSAGAQVLRLRPGLRLVLVTGLLWLLSLLKPSFQILLEEQGLLKPWMETQHRRGWDSRKTTLASDDVLPSCGPTTRLY